MKKLYFLFIGLLFWCSSNAQIIDFPDVKFKNKLLASTTNTNPTYYLIAADATKNDMIVDTNGNGEIEIEEAQAVYYLTVQGNSLNTNDPNNLTDLTGIAYFTNLIELNCADNLLTTLDVSTLSNLKTFRCDRNNLSTLDISGLSNMITFYYGSNNLSNVNLSSLGLLNELGCDNNQITNLDLTPLAQLKVLICSNNQISNLDFSTTSNLRTLFCDNNLLTNLNLVDLSEFYILHCQNNPLKVLNLKNGWPFSYNDMYNMNLANCPLEYVCVDDSNITAFETKLNSYGYTNYNLNSYCSFVPGGPYWTIQGHVKFDADANGCVADATALPWLKLLVSAGNNSGTFSANASGHYSIPLQYGTHTVTPIMEHPEYFNISPSSFTTTFPLFPVGPDPVQNFCITPLGTHNDLETVLLPIGSARPGFDSQYKIIYKNNGNTTLSGDVRLTFMDELMDFVTASPSISSQLPNELIFSYQNLQPFERREILVNFNINSPTETPAVIAGTDLGFSTVIFPLENDDYILDNFSALKQKAVNSFDPNDKTCLEGSTISPQDVGKYVHYMIRFENSGTANAQSIVVKDLIDLSKFEIASLVALDGSHEFYTRIKDNKVEFIFENINLPFDDANNDGYVLFKIRTRPTLVLGDTFSNTASIYFDYNFPIVTEPATTMISVLAITDFDFDQYLTLYPNPVENILCFELKNAISLNSISIYNTLGQLVLVLPNAKASKSIDVSTLKSGTYFIKINSEKGTSNAKFIKK